MTDKEAPRRETKPEPKAEPTAEPELEAPTSNDVGEQTLTSADEAESD
jgi:hypothetical protein